MTQGIASKPGVQGGFGAKWLPAVRRQSFLVQPFSPHAPLGLLKNDLNPDSPLTLRECSRFFLGRSIGRNPGTPCMVMEC
jgi:hypothetical protein